MKDIGIEQDADTKRGLERDPSLSLRVSVVVPAHGRSDDLRYCIEALESSDLPRDEWELIVIDDAEARGPAWARNRGAEKARSRIVAFVDSDVMVHADALSLLVARLENHEADAVFGSYDRSPSDAGVVSQYRNLLHHFVHQRSGGAVESFWAGCGAVTMNAFTSAGEFDETRFTRPEIEDVELGYRMRDQGFRIMLDPAIQCTHRKRWTLAGMIRSDFTRRGLPWTKLLVDRGMLASPKGLSLGLSERVSAMFAVALISSLALSAVTRDYLWLWASLGSLTGFVAANGAFLSFLRRERGVVFALASIALHLVYSITATTALVSGAAVYTLASRTSQARYTHRR